MDTSPELRVKYEGENDAIPFALAVASSMDTSPELRVKYEGENEATPLLEAVASSPAILRVTSVPDFATVRSIPSPPSNLRSSVRRATFAVVLSSTTSTVRVAATSWKVTVPLPSVIRACPEVVPSVVGRVYAPENST